MKPLLLCTAALVSIAITAFAVDPIESKLYCPEGIAESAAVDFVFKRETGQYLFVCAYLDPSVGTNPEMKDLIETMRTNQKNEREEILLKGESKLNSEYRLAFTDGKMPPVTLAVVSPLDPMTLRFSKKDGPSLAGSRVDCDRKTCSIKFDCHKANVLACRPPFSTKIVTPDTRVGILEVLEGEPRYVDAFFSYKGSYYSSFGTEEGSTGHFGDPPLFWPQTVEKLNAHVTFDGKVIGDVTVDFGGKTADPLLRKGAPVMSDKLALPKGGGEFSIDEYVLKYRPVVATTSEKFSDPELWKPWRKGLPPRVSKLKEPYYEKLVQKKDEFDFKIYHSRNEKWLIGSRSKKSKHPGYEWFYDDGAKMRTSFGEGMGLIDIGDYNGDGRVEFLFISWAKDVEPFGTPDRTRVRYRLVDFSGTNQAPIVYSAKAMR